MPSDLDIFSPERSTTKAWCIQCSAKRRPRATAWARSFSWCGNLRSSPPACRSKPSPRMPEAHHDALAVPARPPVTPRRRPRRLARLGQLPQGEVGRVALALGADHLALAAAGEHVVERLLRQQAVVLDRAHRQVHAVVGAVGAADLQQLADHLDHLVDPLRRARDVGRTLEADAVHGVPPHRLAAHGDLGGIAALALGPLDDLVLDVGDVGDEPDVEPAPREVAPQDVVLQRRPAVAEVRRAVHGGAAQVDRHRAGVAQRQLADLPGGGVVQAQHDAQR